MQYLESSVAKTFLNNKLKLNDKKNRKITFLKVYFIS